MNTSNEYDRIVFNQDKYEKVSGKINRLLKLVKQPPSEEISKVESYEELLFEKEFMISLFSEVKNLDKYTRDNFVRNNPPEPKILPYVYYDIYLTEKSFIKNLPESSHEFYDRDDYDFDQFPYPFQDYIFDDGKDSMNELYEAYNNDSYTDLKAIQEDLKEDLKKHNLRFYIDIFASIKTKLNSTNEVTWDPVESLSSMLLWLYGGAGLGSDYMYLIDNSLINNAPIDDNYFFHSVDKFNNHRLNGAKIYFRIYLIDYLLKMKKKKFSRNRVGINYFLEDYKDKKDDQLITAAPGVVGRFIHNIATDIDEDGRSNYKYHHVKVYLETYHHDKSLRSVRRRRDEAVNKLKREGKAYELLDNAADNVLGNGTKKSTGWQKKLDNALGNMK